MKKIVICLMFALIFSAFLIIGCTAQENALDETSVNAIKDNNKTINISNNTTVQYEGNTPNTSQNKTDITYEPQNNTQPQKNESVQNETESISVTVDMPASIENNCVGFLIGAPEETENIELIGAAWARPHPGPFGWGAIEPTPGAYDFSSTDEFVRSAQENNVTILATVWPFAEWDQVSDEDCKVNKNDIFFPRKPFGKDGIVPYRCKPKDKEAYKKFLSTLIERYDGDGVNDMPDLKIPIKYWEILNEPEMKSEDLTFFIGDEEDYLEVIKDSYTTIKQGCPECKVLHGGAAGSQQEFLAFWGGFLKIGGGEYFDIANIHYIGSGDSATLNVAPFKELLDKYGIQKPIWVTEAEFKDENADVKGIANGAFEAGAERIFFVSFRVGGHEPSPIGEYDKIYEEIVAMCPKND